VNGPVGDLKQSVTKRRLVEAPAGSAGQTKMKLSIVMPVYDERRTIARAITQVLRTELPCEYELIVVNDGSTDGTTEILHALRHQCARVIEHPRNMGKGAALLTGATVATGTHLVPFDADLEYDPADLARVIVPVMHGRCDVVYGVRLFGANTSYQSYRHAVANRALTMAASVMFDAALTDIHTCLKLLPVWLFKELDLEESGFGLDTEITAKLLAAGVRPFEVPVSYHSRSAAAGKKIRWRDGVECLQVLARIRSHGRPRALSASVDDPLDTLAASIGALAELTGVMETHEVAHEIELAS
jgi:glycosyltransferase involved in cell wall biosynthesis